MLGIEDQAHVEGLDHLGGRHRAEAHVKEVLGEGEVRARRDGRLAVPVAVVMGDDDRDAGEKPHRLAPRRRLRIVRRLRVLEREERDAGAQRVHRMGLGRELGDHPVHPLREMPLGAFGLHEGLKFGAGRKLAVPEQIGDLLERTEIGQILHRIATIGEAVGLRHDLGDRRVVGIDPDQPFLDLDASVLAHLSSPSCLGRRPRASRGRGMMRFLNRPGNPRLRKYPVHPPPAPRRGGRG